MRVASSLMLLAAIGCAAGGDGGNGPDPHTVMLSITVAGGSTQTGVVGEELAQAIVVSVSDTGAGLSAAVPVPGQLVNFVVVSGGGSVFAGAGLTNAQGEVRERWTLGMLVGDQVLEARAVDASTGDPIVFAQVTATAIPVPPPPQPNHLEYALTMPDTIAADVPFDLTGLISVWEADSTGAKVRDIPFTIARVWWGGISAGSPTPPACLVSGMVITCSASDYGTPNVTPGWYEGRWYIYLDPTPTADPYGYVYVFDAN